MRTSFRSTTGRIESVVTRSPAAFSLGGVECVKHFPLEGHGDLRIKRKTQPVCVYSVPVDSLVAETA